MRSCPPDERATIRTATNGQPSEALSLPSRRIACHPHRSASSIELHRRPGKAGRRLVRRFVLHAAPTQPRRSLALRRECSASTHEHIVSLLEALPKILDDARKSIPVHNDGFRSIFRTAISDCRTADSLQVSHRGRRALSSCLVLLKRTQRAFAMPDSRGAKQV